jgi:glycosyltransferase involved in cell wall biosynthesis
VGQDKLEGGRRIDGQERAVDPSLPVVSIVTPVFNGARYLEQTLVSLHSQGYPNLEHIVMDGRSTDETLSILRRWSDRITYWRSEPDQGMYDALSKGFAVSTGEILGWLNADDMHTPWCLRVLAVMFREPKVHWLTGISSIWTTNGVNCGLPLVARVFPRPLIRLGLYHGQSLGYIQQESTFWTRSLWERAGGLNPSFRFAGDYHLWKSFAKIERLYTVNCLLAGFRRHEGQLTHTPEGYVAELGRDVNHLSRLLQYARYFVIPATSLLLRSSHILRYKGSSSA